MKKVAELRGLSLEELIVQKGEQDALTKQANDHYLAHRQASQAYGIAVACLKIGAWIGDTVRIEGKYAGKQNPLGKLMGFENLDFITPWPLVRLFKKDGSLSENISSIYGQKVTKAD